MTILHIPPQTVQTLLSHWDATVRLPAMVGDHLVHALSDDSRQVEPGVIFVARPGVQHRATDYIPSALARGASLVLTEIPWPDAHCLTVPHLGAALWQMVGKASAVDLSALHIIGVTGTNGKTSVAHFIAGALRRSEAPQTDAVGLIGTLGVGLWSASLDRLQPTANTTPGLLEILSCCVAFARADVRYVVMEVSSHALDQNRLDGVPVQMAVFTNISRDHLDYHRDMADYFSAKAKLFARPELKAAIVNFDSEQSNALFEQITETATCWTYGLGDPDWWVADCQQIIMKNLIARPSGLHLTLMTPLGEAVLDSFLIGLFNASNLLAALATLLALGMPLTMALSGLSQASAPPGRMQSLPLANEAKVIIDYAHTPDALKQVLLALRDHRAGKGRILCLFGCGGARDSGKRPLMGAVAEQLADVIVLTNDNPRSETPQAIIDDILSGISTHATVTVEPDRRRAIDAVLSMAQPDDWVLIAGKGHETTQDLAGVLHPFNDGETVRNWIAGRAT